MAINYNPNNVPIQNAATIILLANTTKLKILMMQRNIKTIFGGGMWVFPGGRVDKTDQSHTLHALSTDKTDQCASNILKVPNGGLDYYLAAIRETFEEAGILLAKNKTTQAQLNFNHQQTINKFIIYRKNLNNQIQTFEEIIHQENLILDTKNMHYVSRWITPNGPPRRFDARFFVAQMPSSQVALHDNNELVNSIWISPQEILKRHAKDSMRLMEPTLRVVKNLSLFGSSSAVMSAAADIDKPYHRVRFRGKHDLLVPGEPGYEEADENVEFGLIRLRP